MAVDKKRDSFFLGGKRDKINKDEETKANVKKQREEAFDMNRGVEKEKKNNTTDKKPFDKKTYRLKKYSKKYKLEQWEEQRKKKLLKDYYKEVKNDPLAGTYKPVSFDEDTIDNPETTGKFVRHPDLVEKEQTSDVKKNQHPYQKAKEHFEKVKQEKMNKQKEIEKAKVERLQKMQEYKKKKQERFKKLSKKTKRGQPVMGGRLEMLLDKIQKG